MLSFRLAEAEGKGKSLGAQFAARRRAFKRDLELVGEWEVQQAFYDSFAGQARNQLHNLGLLLRDLVLWSERRLMDSRMRDGGRMGKLSVAKLIEELAKRGLSLGMTPVEVDEVFGPVGTLPFQFFVYRAKGTWNRERVEGQRIVLEAVSDGKCYASMNGEFMIPPGDYRVVEPEIHGEDDEKTVKVDLLIERRYVSSRSRDIYIKN